MTAQRHLTATFCDDIRREEGNKLSYMGVYGGNLLVPSFPQVLPKLCIAIRMTTSPSPPGQLIFRLLKDEEIIAESEIPSDVLTRMPSVESDSSETPMHVVATVFQLFPLDLTGPCKFRARAICDGEEFKGGSLIVDQLPPDFQLGGPIFVPSIPTSIS
jgi:hypothetical protein